MPRIRRLELTRKQQAELADKRDHDPRPYVRERCGALLKISQGATAHAVAKQGLLKEREADTLYRWMDLYEAQGLEGVMTHQHGGARRRPFLSRPDRHFTAKRPRRPSSRPNSNSSNG